MRRCRLLIHGRKSKGSWSKLPQGSSPPESGRTAWPPTRLCSGQLLLTFSRQPEKFLFLTTKSADVSLFLDLEPTPQVWVSFSINAAAAWERFESHTPHPYERLAAARALQEAGWRVRVRIDPIIAEIGMNHYQDITQKVSRLAPERVTVGTLRKLPGLFSGKSAAAVRHHTSPSGVRFYRESMRAKIYRRMADWLGFQPALCRETYELWERLAWEPIACNCTAGD